MACWLLTLASSAWPLLQGHENESSEENEEVFVMMLIHSEMHVYKYTSF